MCGARDPTELNALPNPSANLYVNIWMHNIYVYICYAKSDAFLFKKTVQCYQSYSGIYCCAQQRKT